MSSHHIVRDQQEPALLIHNLDGFPIPILHSLLEWLPTVLCFENSIEKYTMYGHKLDIALVGFEKSEFWERELLYQQPVDILKVNDNVSVGVAMMTLSDKAHRTVNVITSEQSLFEILSELGEWMEKMDVVIFTELRRYVIQKTSSFQKWLAAPTELSIISLKSPSYFATTGFDHNLDGDQVKDPILLTKKTEGPIEIKGSGFPYLIGETY